MTRTFNNIKEAKQMVEDLVCNEMDNLEDIINTKLGGIIDEAFGKLDTETRSELVVKAREVFFKG